MEDLKEHIEKILKPYRDIQKIADPIKQIQLNIEKSFEPLKRIRKSFETINTIYASGFHFENPFIQYLNSFKEIAERLKKYSENIPQYLLVVAQNGWFLELNMEFDFPLKLATEIQEGNIEEANRLLIEYYSRNIDRIFNELVHRHLERKQVLNQILAGYKEEYYYLVIPAILAQIDGICFDFTNKKFFIKEKNNRYLPQVTSELEKLKGSFLSLYLSPLQNQTPIMARELDINKFPCHLNRHEILHGTNSSYGTKISSLKVISLLKYVSDLLLEIDEKY